MTDMPVGLNSIRKMNTLSKISASWQEAGADSHDQRIDNYLHKILKGVPKSHIYRILRSGEVRVNSRRISQTYRLQAGDRIRLPPIRTTTSVGKAGVAKCAPFGGTILYEDDDFLIVNKPGGVAVHGGSGIASGVIEQLRAARPGAKFLELAHRLDRETSGVLALAKKRSALIALHNQLREGEVKKHYLALVLGKWGDKKRNVRLGLQKQSAPSGDRRVVVDEKSGKESHTIFTLIKNAGEFSLLNAELKTGRTHQIRVHLSHLGFPIAGDEKYGDFTANRKLAKTGLKRMFLHAASLEFRHPRQNDWLRVDAPLAPELQNFLQSVGDDSA